MPQGGKNRTGGGGRQVRVPSKKRTIAKKPFFITADTWGTNNSDGKLTNQEVR